MQFRGKLDNREQHWSVAVSVTTNMGIYFTEEI